MYFPKRFDVRLDSNQNAIFMFFQFYSGRKHKNVYLARMYDYLSYFLNVP